MRSESRSRWALWCAAAAGVTIAVSSVTPWIRVGERDSGHFFVSWTIPGWRYTGFLSEGAIGSSPSDPHHPGGIGGGVGDVTILLGVLIAALAFAAARGRHWRGGHALAAALAAGVCMVIPLSVLWSAHHGNGIDAGRPLEQPGYGLWLTLSASAAAAIASVVSLKRHRR